MNVAVDNCGKTEGKRNREVTNYTEIPSFDREIGKEAGKTDK